MTAIDVQPAPWAPDFTSRPDKAFPSLGERIGPAWRMVWGYLAGGRIVARQELIALMMTYGLAERTCLNLLQEAVRCELLLIHSQAAKTKPPKLIRADMYYRAHPDETPAGWTPPVKPVAP
jgi:hypothetical protein